MKSLTMTSIIPRRSFHFFTLLTVFSLLFIATHNFYRMEPLRSVATSVTAVTAGPISETSVYGCDDIPIWQSQLIHRASLPPIAGHRNTKERKLLTIGISSVYREENYLQTTLESLVNESDAEEQKDTVVVIYLADTDQEKKDKQLRLIQKKFQKHLDSGFFQVVESGPEIYPPMDFALTKRTFNDSVDRVLWRTKQVVDFAFLFSYAKPLSTYHLVIEDDIIASTQYISAVKDFIKSRRGRWVALHFSGFLGIGLLFHNSDLGNLIRLLLMFHQEQPVDMLMRQFISLQVPDEAVARRIPSIFQHIGFKSTLPNKVQKLKDNTFDMARRRYKNHNPPADLITTMKVYNDLSPEYAYRPSPGLFWGISKPHDTFDIIFQKPISISRFVVLSGIPTMNTNQKTMKDFIMDGGKLERSSKFIKVAPDNSAVCDNFTTLSEFKSGDADVWKDKEKASEGQSFSSKLEAVQCLRVRIGPNQKSWVILREIQVFKS